MKVMTIFGTRPEIIRLSLVMRRLDSACQHITVHTGQNFDEKLSDVFFRELEVRDPDVHLGVRSSSFGQQTGQIVERIDTVLGEHRPDKVLILGDTNSALSAIVAARRGVPIFHMEAGNRCYDDRVPEEINRRIIDHSSTFLLPYTQRSKDNLVREGIERERIFVTGNPIFDVLEHFSEKIDASDALERLGVNAKKYFLVTLHRAENVDAASRLSGIFSGLEAVGKEHGNPVLVSVHPRTRVKLKNFGVSVDDRNIRLLEPMGLFDFVKLEKNALAVLTDSGTVQEECCIFGVANVTLRDVTERPETVECGSNILSGGDPEMMVRAVGLALLNERAWQAPPEYLARNVASVVSNIVLGYSSVRQYT